MQKGFTVIELMITITILGILVALALPAILAPKKAANESSAISSLRTLTAANVIYKSRYGTYAPSLAELEKRGLLNPQLAAADGPDGKSGYQFVYTGGATTWSAQADPQSPGASGDRHFFVNETGVIRSNGSAPASATDGPIGEVPTEVAADADPVPAV